MNTSEWIDLLHHEALAMNEKLDDEIHLAQMEFVHTEESAYDQDEIPQILDDIALRLRVEWCRQPYTWADDLTAYCFVKGE